MLKRIGDVIDNGAGAGLAPLVVTDAEYLHQLALGAGAGFDGGEDDVGIATVSSGLSLCAYKYAFVWHGVCYLLFSVCAFCLMLVNDAQGQLSDTSDGMYEDAVERDAYLGTFGYEDAMYPTSTWKAFSAGQRSEHLIVGNWCGPSFRNVRFSQQLLQQRLPGSDGSVALRTAVHRPGGACAITAGFAFFLRMSLHRCCNIFMPFGHLLLMAGPTLQCLHVCRSSRAA